MCCFWLNSEHCSIYANCIEQCLFSQVPSLNDVPVHYLKPNSLVKFRCMVQDMFDPEFYMAVYETVDPNTNARVSEILICHFTHSGLCISLVCELYLWSLDTDSNSVQLQWHQ